MTVRGVIINLLMAIAAGGITAFGASAVGDTDTDGPYITFPDNNRTIDLGYFYADSIQTGTITILNTGNEELVINSIFNDCHCVRATFPRQPIAPGDSARISVSFNGHGRMPGGIMKIMKIRSNAINNYERITVKGEIRRDNR